MNTRCRLCMSDAEWGKSFDPIVLTEVFTCGEADRSSRGKWVLLLPSFFLSVIWSKKVKVAQTNLVAYVVWPKISNLILKFTSEAVLEVTVASKPHFLCWSQIDGKIFF